MDANPDLVSFYRGQSGDHRGRRLRDLRAMSLEAMEASHDSLQWLFPLREKSQYNPLAPTLDPGQVAEFRADPALRNELLESWHRFLTFYGLSCKGDGVCLAANFPARKKVWLKSGNHNHLRISRILRSLTILGLEQQAQSMLKCLEGLGWWDRWRLGGETYRHWRNAVTSA